jgi:multiple sugar transport system ATP-binding protein
MGSDSLLWLTLAGNPLRARASADHGFTHGQPVRIGFDISRASLFDVASEQRL